MGYDMYYEDRDGLTQEQAYFRYNIFGMEQGRNALEKAGLLSWDIPEPKWPKAEDEAEDFVSADYGGVIPGWKLCSNDGWLCRPEEIERGRVSAETELALADIKGDPDEDDDAYAASFVRWVLESAKHGGFRVY